MYINKEINHGSESWVRKIFPAKIEYNIDIWAQCDKLSHDIKKKNYIKSLKAYLELVRIIWLHKCAKYTSKKDQYYKWFVPS